MRRWEQLKDSDTGGEFCTFPSRPWTLGHDAIFCNFDEYRGLTVSLEPGSIIDLNNSFERVPFVGPSRGICRRIRKEPQGYYDTSKRGRVCRPGLQDNVM